MKNKYYILCYFKQPNFCFTENLTNEESTDKETFTTKYENPQENKDTSDEYFSFNSNSYEYETGDQYLDTNL